MGGGVSFFHPRLKNKTPSPPSGKGKSLLSRASRGQSGVGKGRDRPAERTGTAPCSRETPASLRMSIRVRLASGAVHGSEPSRSGEWQETILLTDVIKDCSKKQEQWPLLTLPQVGGFGESGNGNITRPRDCGGHVVRGALKCELIRVSGQREAIVLTPAVKECQSMRPASSRIRQLGCLVLLMMAVSVLIPIGCRKRSSPHGGSTPVEIRVGYQPFTSDLAIFVAMENGYFNDEGVVPRLAMFRSTTDFLNALVADRIDVAGIIGAPTLFAHECEKPGLIRVFLPAVETQQRYVAAFLVPKGSPIQSISELRGKTVGTYSGTTQALNLKYILSKFFDPEKDARIVQVSSELQLQALAGGQFDALLTIEPYRTLGVAKGIARVLEENPRCKYIMSPFPASAMAVSNTYLQRDPEAFKKYYRAIRKAVDFINAKPSEAKAILPKYTELTKEVAAESNVYEWQYDEAVDKAKFQELADLYSERGVLTKKIDAVGMFASPGVLGIDPK